MSIRELPKRLDCVSLWFRANGGAPASRLRQSCRGYGIALAAVTAGFLLRWTLTRQVGEDLPTYITFYPAVMVAALLGGLGPGLLSTALTVVAVDYWIASPKEWFFRGPPAEATGVVLFSLMAVFVCLLMEGYRQARQRAAAYEKELALQESQEALRKSREDLNHAQAVAHVGSWRLSVQRNELVWSEENWRLFGVPQGTPLTYETFLATVHPEDREYVDRKWKAALGGEPYDIEHRIVVGNTVKWVRERAELEFDSNGTVLGGFGTTQDITDRKRAEAALAQAHSELELKVKERTARLRQIVDRLRTEIRNRREAERQIKEAELRYRTVANFTYDWEYWKAPEGSLRFCSPSCERVSGYTAAELIADPKLLDQMVHPDDRTLWHEHQRQALANPGRCVIQFRIRCKRGATRWLEHACTGVIGEGGEFLGIRASNRDVTDRRQSEMETQLLQAELARTSRIATVGQLAGSLAHELNQPLGAILCNAQTAETLLEHDHPPPETLREVLADIKADSKRAAAVIQRLRALYQHGDRERSVLELNRIIQETVDLLHSEFILRGVHVHLTLCETLPRILGNLVELQQVVLNLVTNALEAMTTQAPPTRKVRISTYLEDSENVGAFVRDSGPGLSEEHLGRIFEPFFTTKPAGMGMGLALSQSIMEAHGGRLRAANHPDGGAVFYLTLPASSGDTR